ncbi:MAG: hypothetical protein ABSE62_08085 [Chthoniobacteraceae bacterium]|jgi:hypothetical protein
MRFRIFLSITVVAIGLALSGCDADHGRAAAERAAADFHDQFGKGDFAGIYAATDSDFKASTPEKKFDALLEAIQTKLGKIQDTGEAQWTFNIMNQTKNVRLIFETKYDHGHAYEIFDFRIKDGQAVLRGYRIQSPTVALQ